MFVCVCVCKGKRERKREREEERRKKGESNSLNECTRGRRGKREGAYLWASGCSKRAWKRGEGEREMNCIVLCNVGEERGLRLETWDSDWGLSHSELQMALRKPIKPAYTLSTSRSHTPCLGVLHTHAPSCTYMVFSVGWSSLHYWSPSMWLECSRHTQPYTHVQAHTYTHWSLVWNLICLAHS